MADAVLLLSKKFEKTFRERAGVQNTYYFPNFIRPEDYPEHKKDPEKFVYLGKLNKDKGIDMLLQALYMMAADGERPEVILAGTGDREKYERYINENRHVVDSFAADKGVIYAGIHPGEGMEKWPGHQPDLR